MFVGEIILFKGLVQGDISVLLIHKLLIYTERKIVIV